MEKEMSVRILKEFCKGCEYCVDTCPKAVFQLRKDPEDLNAKGYYVPIIAQPEKCTKCRMCELICPDFAIEVEE
jgi:2-oxoglutarate ferredoxin oxidoreductase subunit delta